MAWESRDGRLYYYDKRRVDGRVVSRYVGRGLEAQLAENMNELARLEREELREEKKRRHKIDREVDAHVRRTVCAVRLLTDAAMLATGYHKHKGQWRRRRGYIATA